MVQKIEQEKQISAEFTFIVRNKCNAKYKWLHALGNRLCGNVVRKASVKRLCLKADHEQFWHLIFKMK